MRNRQSVSRLPAVFGHALVVAVSFLAGAVPAHAGLIQFALFRDGFYTQNSTSQPTTADSFNINARGFVNNLTDFTSMSMTSPGPTQTLSPVTGSNPPFWISPSPSFATQAALNSAFSTGTYTLTGTPTNGVSTLGISYTQDAYATTIPFLTGTTFTSLQGLDPTKSFTFTWNSYGTGSVANESDIFFTIFNRSTSAVIFSQGFLPSTATSLVLPANTLLANTAYSFTLDFSNRINSLPAASTVQGFDLDTSGNFTTGSPAAVPEPATFVMAIGAGGIGLGIWGIRRRSRGSRQAGKGVRAERGQERMALG